MTAETDGGITRAHIKLINQIFSPYEEPKIDPDSILEDPQLSRHLRDVVTATLEILSARQKQALYLRFGLADGEGRPLDQVGVQIESRTGQRGVSSSGTRYVVAAAIRTLKIPKNSVPFVEFLPENHPHLELLKSRGLLE